MTLSSPNSCLVLTNASEDGKIHGEGQRGVWRERQREKDARVSQIFREVKCLGLFKTSFIKTGV